MELSIVVPCYNEEEALPYFMEALTKIEASLPLTVAYYFVDDGSTDGTLTVLRKLAATNPRCHFQSFSRNFGKEAGLLAGLTQAQGDYVVVMDADLQDPPEMLAEMLRLIQEEHFDVVGTRRMDRKGEPILRSLFSRMFYYLMSKISKTPMLSGVRDYRMMTRQVVDSILSLQEYNRFSKGIFSWVGYRTTYLPYENRERIAGKTSWSFWSLFSYSLEAIVNFSDFPLTIASFTGIISCLLAAIFMIVIVVRTLIFGDPTSGWPSLATIVLFVGGLQLFALGIVGKYIGKIFLETKDRPHYIIKESDEKKEQTDELSR
ncbi:glycosyltransferase family 2 protein [Enterococcus nangangensis]|uniref:glycosyltransferase family 2 protein n=1 Tax=Enterococcus nangangensis TaxID=2559926 RepID=UPI0010F971D1|nr:glycosyltransferase family 2 protein [Enterococcus nangangensis]